MNKLVIFICVSVLFASCQKYTMQEIKIVYVINGRLASNPNDPLPNKLKTLINPIEHGDTVYIPHVFVYRTDLPNREMYKIEVESDAANKLRKWAKTYDYSNLKEDYRENLQYLKAGEYLSDNGETPRNFSRNPDDIEYRIIRGRTRIDSILSVIIVRIQRNIELLNNRFILIETDRGPDHNDSQNSTPRLSFSKTVVDFSNIEYSIGEKPVDTIVVYNTGNIQGILDRPRKSGEETNWYSLNPDDGNRIIIPPQKKTTIWFNFLPQYAISPGQKNSTITFNTNDPNRTTVTFRVVGNIKNE